MNRHLSGSEPVGFEMLPLIAFVRISTLSAAWTAPLSVEAAFDQVEEWLAQPPAILVRPGPRHLSICRDLLERSGTAGNLTSDAHLAAVAIERGATLSSFDGDMHRFSGLRLEYLG